MSFELPKLPYGLDGLEPYISKTTMEHHYGKHHQAYVTNLNNLSAGTQFEGSSLEHIIKTADGGIFNNGAQVWNHTFYFMQLSANGKKSPDGELLTAINAGFGSLINFKDEFTKAGASLFGSGWVWLSVNQNNKLVITQEQNAGNPLRAGLKPILTCDVWEHAYYLDTQNRRPDYIKNFWDIVDWNIINSRYNTIIMGK